MASWLADQVGESGSVLAVDRDVTLLRSLADLPNVEVVESAIEDLDWPSASVDLIHTRNVLMHIDHANSIIARLVNTVRPGGVLLLEEASCFPLAGMTSLPSPRLPEPWWANGHGPERCQIPSRSCQSRIWESRSIPQCFRADHRKRLFGRTPFARWRNDSLIRSWPRRAAARP